MSAETLARPNQRTRVLITGATGFVGRPLLAALASHEMFAVTAAVRRDVVLPSGVSSVRIDDVGPTTAWGPAISGHDAVVHLAARVHVMRDERSDPLDAYRRVNVGGTLALVEQAAAAGVRRFVFVSSIKVNGERTRPGRAFTESDPSLPSDAYGISKMEAEAGLRALARESGMEIVVIRPPLIYGPGVKANFLSMTRWLQRGFPLPLGAIHHNRRSLVGIDNLVDLIVTCLHHPAAANEVFLAGDGEDLSTTDLLRRTAVALGVRPRLVPIPAGFLGAVAVLLGKRATWQRLGGSLQVDITKARTRLGWHPPVSVDEGLKRAVRSLASAKGPA